VKDDTINKTSIILNSLLAILLTRMKCATEVRADVGEIIITTMSRVGDLLLRTEQESYYDAIITEDTTASG